MNLLIFEYEHMAIEDLREALTNLGHTYTVITDENIYNHVDEAFDARFDKLIESIVAQLSRQKSKIFIMN